MAGTTPSAPRHALRPAPGQVPLMVDPTGDAERLRALRRMRAVATGLLVFAAAVFWATHGRDGFWGYVNAGAEASMVGAIADWFAVTALFRHPLGIPVPHTALIPRRKDDLGRGLEEFVGSNFLSEEIVREQIAAARVSGRVGTWLEDPGHRSWLVAEGSVLASSAMGRVSDDQITDLVSSALVPRFRDEPIAPLLGTTLGELVADELHRPVVDLALEEMQRWLEQNPDTFAKVLGERAPWWTPTRVNDAVTSKVHAEAVRWLADIRSDPGHRARAAVDGMLAQLATDLLHDDSTIERAERLKNRLLDHPQMEQAAISLWQASRSALVGSVDDPEGAVRLRVASALESLATRLHTDDELRARIDGIVADAAVFMVERYGREVLGVITHTIQRWDGAEAASKIELHVGRDLQFIRINGTIVGGLVGVTIHAITQLLG